MRKKVVVIGGGVAGLSAAHELAERGFEVELYERRDAFGGKAASATSRFGFPGEHGFRFFPGWYRHLPDTMKRIPYKDGKSVFDNLVAAGVNLFACYERDSIHAILRLPTSWSEAKVLAAFPQDIARLGLTFDDIRFFLGKLLEFATASESERLAKYEGVTWWEFMDAPKRSEAFCNYLVEGITRNSVAAKARVASAYTISRVALRTLVDVIQPGSMVDRVLNAPTNEAWLKPWEDHLKAQGVTLVTDAELDSVEFDGNRIRSLRIVRGSLARHRTNAKVDALKAMIDINTRWRAFRTARDLDDSAGPDRKDLEALLESWTDCFLAGGADEKVSQWLSALATQEKAPDTGEREVRSPEDVGGPNGTLNGALPDLQKVTCAKTEQLEKALAQAKIDRTEALRMMDESCACSVEADFFVFAVPVEQMAYYVRRSEMMIRHDPSLKTIIPLSEHVDWMSGIQFYLTEELDITRGHVDCLDSEWHLTAISQAQFWPNVDLAERGARQYRGKVKGILSVDISAWDKRGQLHRKEAFDCTPTEIAEEVWSQLKRSLNRPNCAPVLRDELLLDSDGTNVPQASFYLDASIVDRFDRKKQAFFQKFESVRFSAEALRARQAKGGTGDSQTMAFGSRRNLNAEPLLINRAGARALRPSVKTHIPNMFLAGDYVQTHTDLATMEAANEAARTAVNEIVLASGVRQPLCDIWPLHYALDVLSSMDRALSFGKRPAEASAQLAADAASAVSRLAARTMRAFLNRRG